MGWVLLAIGAAAVAGTITVLRTGARGRRHPDRVRGPEPSRPARGERRERPYREAVHYRASGALPRWDP